MGLIGEFRYAPGVLDGCGGKVVIETQRGIEIGEQVSLTCSGCGQSVRRELITSYLETSNAPELYQLRAGRILRRATSEDLIEWDHIQGDSKNKLARARETSKSMGLSMKFVACEHLFGGERIVFYFMADNRVDFRDMVRELAHEFHTRIEMHQVGARDEARLVADFEICGRECCCKNFLKKLRPVTMRMAKLQKATLDPTKVSGRCGRLRCCLRYEHEGYDELSRKLPRTGSRVRTASGVATVRDRQVLTQLLHVVYDDSEVEETIGVEAIIERDLPRRIVVRQEGEAAGRSAPNSGGRESPRGPRPPGRSRPSSNQSSASIQPATESSGDPQGEAARQVDGNGETSRSGERTDATDRNRALSSRRRSRGRRGRGVSRRRGPRPDEPGSGGGGAGTPP